VSAIGAVDASQTFIRGIAPSIDRERDDFYPTPREATRALFARERFDGGIWECACGDGAISKEAEAAGYDVVSTDLIDRGYGLPRVDFLLEQKLLAPNVVTNPPFKYAEALVQRALDLGAVKVAMLLRLAWLEGSKRRQLFENTPLASVYIASSRLRMARGGDWTEGHGSSMIAFSWFVWDTAHVGAPRLGWFDWKEHA